MRRLRQQQRLAAGFLAACVAVGLLGALTKRREIFPLYSWFLFSLVPTRTVAFDVLVREAGGRAYDPPVSYRRVTESFRNPHSIVAYRAVQDLGRAVETGQETDAARLRRSFEARFKAWPVRYDLVKVASDNPLEHWKNGQPQRSDPLASFAVERPSAAP